MMVGVFIANVLLILVAPSAGRSDDSYGKRDCTPGYDPDCPTPMTLTGSSLSPSASPRAATQPQHQTSSSSKKTLSAHAAETEKCLDVPDECVFPFSYKDRQYTTCTEVDAVGTKWCSADKDFHGSWKECKKTCKDKWPVKTIVGTAVAGGVAAAGLGITLAATELMKHKKERSQVPVMEARSQAISVPNGALNNPASSFGAIAASGTPGVQVESTPASVPVVAARFLDKQPLNAVPVTVGAPVTAKVVLQTVTTAPTQVNGWLVGFAIAAVAVCCCVCMSGIVAACRSGLGKKRKHGNFIEVQDEASPGYPATVNPSFYHDRWVQYLPTILTNLEQDGPGPAPAVEITETKTIIHERQTSESKTGGRSHTRDGSRMMGASMMEHKKQKDLEQKKQFDFGRPTSAKRVGREEEEVFAFPTIQAEPVRKSGPSEADTHKSRRSVAIHIDSSSLLGSLLRQELSLISLENNQ